MHLSELCRLIDLPAAMADRVLAFDRDFDYSATDAIGTGIIGGTLASTILGVFFIPVFFVVVLKLFRVRRVSEKTAEEEAAAAAMLPAPLAHH